jgi:hypothetical protein
VRKKIKTRQGCQDETATRQNGDRWSQQHDAWSERLDTYRQSPEGQVHIADLQSRIKFGEKLVEAAERRAGVTCELYGATAVLHHTPARSHWYKTLCLTCAEREKYVLSIGSNARQTLKHATFGL